MLNNLAFIGVQEGMIVLVVVLVLFGGKKIPELLRGVGQGVGELQKGLDEGRRQLNQSIHETRTEDRLEDRVEHDAEDTVRK
jgi:sec-independent protein translocase protein TatA